MIPVAEIFGPTIQGEGPNTGLKTLFVRVVGCDFKCEWCDSKFAWKVDENTKTYTPEELTKILLFECKHSNTANVVLTGGNPCLYDFSKVIEQLHDAGISIDIETQGSKLPDWVYKVDTLVISPKAPSSKQIDVYENVYNFLANEEKVPINFNVAIKIPIFTEEDFEFASKYYDMINDLIWNTNINAKLYLNVGNTNTNEPGDISKRVLLDYEQLINKTMQSGMKRVYVMPQIHTLVYGNKQAV